MKSAIVFGGSRGIGRMIVEHLIEQKYGVTVVSRNLSNENGFNNLDGIHLLYGDITDEKFVAECFELHNGFFCDSPELVINTAAIQGPVGPTWAIPLDNWQQAININLTGSFIVTKYAIQSMLLKGLGSIILFSGGGAAFPRPNFTAYGVCKTGVLRFVETVSEELKVINPAIIINAISPGAVKTTMTDEIIKAGERAGLAALNEARQIDQNGGTPKEHITSLIDFLSNTKENQLISGRLIHVREKYREFVSSHPAGLPEEAGKLRRVPL